jgi:excisionase family DNA binding protein
MPVLAVPDAEHDVLDEACPVHEVPSGVQCPDATGGACQSRYATAAARWWLAGFPEAGKLDRAPFGQLIVLALKARDIVQGQQDVIDRMPVLGEALTRAEVAAMLHVEPKTVTNWARTGKLTSFRTIGGQRRYREAEVRALAARRR